MSNLEMGNSMLYRIQARQNGSQCLQKK